MNIPTLFSPDYISNTVDFFPNLPLQMRPLALDDNEKGFLVLLEQLTRVGNMSRQHFRDVFHRLQSVPGQYYIVVVEDLTTNTVVASGTLFVEQKYIHCGGLLGHIEDVVVDQGYRSEGLGKSIISQLKHIGNRQGCYKIILNCAEKNTGFYEKFGFEKKGWDMQFLMLDNDESHALGAS